MNQAIQPTPAQRRQKRLDKITTLCQIEGMDELDILEQSLMDGVCPGICQNDNCNQVHYYEPDQREGYCEACGTNTVVSAQELFI